VPVGARIGTYDGGAGSPSGSAAWAGGSGGKGVAVGDAVINGTVVLVGRRVGTAVGKGVSVAGRGVRVSAGGGGGGGTSLGRGGRVLEGNGDDTGAGVLEIAGVLT
jgi:hypothetical protein